MIDYAAVLEEYTNTLRDIRRDYNRANEILRGLTAPSLSGAHNDFPPSPNDAEITSIERKIDTYEKQVRERSAVTESYSKLGTLSDVMLDDAPSTVSSLAVGFRYVIPFSGNAINLFELPSAYSSKQGDMISIICNDLHNKPGEEYFINATWDNEDVSLSTNSGFHFYHNGHRWVAFSNNGDSYVKTGIVESRRGFVRTTKDRIEQFSKARVGEASPWLFNMPDSHKLSGTLTSSNPAILSSDNSIIFARPDSNIYEDSLVAKTDIGIGNIDVVGLVRRSYDDEMHLPLLARDTLTSARLHVTHLDPAGLIVSDSPVLDLTLVHTSELNICSLTARSFFTSSTVPRECFVLDRNIQAGTKGRARLSEVVYDPSNTVSLNFTPVPATNANFISLALNGDVLVWPSATHSGVSKQTDDYIFRTPMEDHDPSYEQFSANTYDFLDIDSIDTRSTNYSGILHAGITSDGKLMLIHDTVDQYEDIEDHSLELTVPLTNSLGQKSKLAIMATNGEYIAVVLNEFNQIDVYAFNFNSDGITIRLIRTLSSTGITGELTDIALTVTDGFESLILSSATEGMAVHRIHVQDNEVYLSGDEETYIPYVPYMHVVRRDNRTFITAPYNNHITDTIVNDTRNGSTTVFEVSGKSAKVHVAIEAIRTGVKNYDNQPELL